MSAVGRLLQVVAVATCLSGCYSATALIASPADYADYRRVRNAETLDVRLAAAWHYLQHRPDGRYHARLRAYFDEAEPLFFAARRRNAAGLDAYLRALPDGPHAAEALSALMGLRQASRRRDLVSESLQRSGLRQQADKEAREKAADLLLAWTAELGAPALYRRPLTEAPASFLRRYRLALPEPECAPPPDALDLTECRKAVEQRFVVAQREGLPEERHIAFVVELTLDERWVPIGAHLRGAGLLLRTAEAAGGVGLDESDVAQQRLAAQQFASRLTERLFGEELTCNGGTAADGTLTLDCETLRITVVPRPGGNDSIAVQVLRAQGDEPS